MAAGIIGANISINLSSGSKSINTILGGTNIYEKIIITVVKIGPNEGVIHVGGSNVSATVFGEVIRTGEKREYLGNTVIGFGANMFVINPSSENVRVDILGFATA